MVLVVRAGEICFTLLLFLEASGMGLITMVDHNNVEVSNIHWQVINTEWRRGISKIIVLEYEYYLFSLCLLD